MSFWRSALPVIGTVAGAALGQPQLGAALGSGLAGIGSSDPRISPQGMNPQLQNQMNSLREMVSNFGNQQVSDRPYDIARRNVSSNAFRTAQNMGNAAQRSLNRRGMLNSGLADKAMGSAYGNAAQQMTTALGGIEQSKIAEQSRRKQQSLAFLQQLLGMGMQGDQFGRGQDMQAQLANLQQSNTNAGAMGQFGAALGGMDWTKIMQQLGLSQAPIEIIP